MKFYEFKKDKNGVYKLLLQIFLQHLILNISKNPIMDIAIVSLVTRV